MMPIPTAWAEKACDVDTTKMENRVKELEARQKLIPFVPSATSYRMGWKTLQAVRYRTTSDSVEYSLPPATRHGVVLTIRPAEKFFLQSEGVKRDRPLHLHSILVLPAGSSVRQHWQGSMEAVVIYLEPSLVARVVTETFELDSARTVVPPLDGFYSPELFSTMLAVDAELRAGNAGGSLLVESLANILAVHLIRHITGPSRELASADGVLPRHKLRTVTEYIIENLGGDPTLEQMAALVHLSPFHFARQFKAATGLAPHQFVITRRIERAQHLLRTNGGLGLGEVAFRSGFANQSHFCFHFKRIAGVTPRRFREGAQMVSRFSNPVGLSTVGEPRIGQRNYSQTN
jgi:AraC family transcriptional regulator